MNRRRANKLLALAPAALYLNPLTLHAQPIRMHTRPIPSTGEALPVIGLGTWQTFDVGSSENERAPLREVLRTLVAHGGSVIDSSPMYGRSEKVVGALTAELGIKGQVFEATKVWTSGERKGQQQMQDSFRHMNPSGLDLLQIHNLLDWKTHLRTLRALKEEGKIRYTGITHYHAGGYPEMEKIMRSEPLDFIQINYNLAVREAAERLLPLAKDRGIAVLINRPYGEGKLFRKVKGKSLPDWAEAFEAESWGQFFLKFILAHPAVTCVIPGTSKAKHMADNAMAGKGALPDATHLTKMKQFISSL